MGNSTVPVLLMGALLGCAAAGGTVSPPIAPVVVVRQDSAESRARQALYDVLKKRLIRNGSDTVPAAFSAFPDSSRLPSGVRYFWGTMVPRNTADVMHVAVVVLRGDSVTVLETPADWFRAVGPLHVGNRQSALDLCGEAVRFTSHAVPEVRPVIHTGTEALERLPGEVPRPEVIRALQTPVVRETAPEQWVAEFWAIELRHLRRYRCSIGGPSPGLEEVEVMRDLGFTPLF